MMDLNRGVCDRISFMVLLLGHIAAAAVLPGTDQKNGFNLDCTNDFEEMMCQLQLQNCADYSMTVRDKDGSDTGSLRVFHGVQIEDCNSGFFGDKNCTLQPCGTEKCCCTFQVILVIGQTHTAQVLKDGKIMESKDIGVTQSLKPKTPEIVSVTESNGNFEVRWKSNMEGFINQELSAMVTYYKKGETTKNISKLLTGLNYYPINGQNLDPSSTYLVSVKSFTALSGKFSDSSPESEFKTPSSTHSQLWVIIISLSIVAVIFSVAIYGLHVKLKTKWWDEVPKPPYTVLSTNPIQQQVLILEQPITYSVCVEPLVIPDDSKLGSKTSLADTSSGISTASSDLSYTNAGCPAAVNGDPPVAKTIHNELSKIFPNIRLISPLTTTQSTSTQESGLLSCHPHGIQANFGSFAFENKTYSFLIPGFPHQTPTNNLEVQVKAEMPCGSEYQPSKSDVANCHFQQVPACEVPAEKGAILPQVVSPLVSTDMSFQAVPICVLKGSHSFPVVEDDYQAFPSQVRQPDVLVLEQRNSEHKEHLDRWEEKSFIKTPQSILGPVVPVQDGQRVSKIQIPFSSLVSAEQSKSIITVSGYQSV